MTDNTQSIRTIVKEEFKDVKTLTEMEAGFARSAARVGKRLPTITEVFAGMFFYLETTGLNKEEMFLAVEMLGRSIRAVMDRADKDAAAKSGFAEAGPADSTWEVWPNADTYKVN